MKLLVMCEGPNEKKVMDMLLKADCLSFTEDDLLGLTTFHARQITTNAQVRTELNIYTGEVKILRIGDKQGDKLTIPKEYRDRIIGIEKYCTKPELEILFIIASGLIHDYEKVKSSVSPKEYAKANIRCGNKKYDNSSKFYEDFFGNNIGLLVESIKEYRRIHGKTHKKGELCLSELLAERVKPSNL